MKRLTDEYGICTDCNGIAFCKTDCMKKKLYDKLKYYEDLEEMVVDDGYLRDWYIHSVCGNDEPIWTDKHIDELCNDFIVIIKGKEV
jgi:hypothetical protein